MSKPIPNNVDEQLTKNFRLKEFHSKDGSPMPRSVYNNVKKLAVELQKLRDAWMSPVTINSGYRSIEYNDKIGGVPNSNHTKGLAADIVVQGLSAKDVHDSIANYIEEKYVKDGGLGKYKTFTHYDIGDKRSRWVGKI